MTNGQKSASDTSLTNELRIQVENSVNTQTVSLSCANIWTLAGSALLDTFCMAKSPKGSSTLV